jgi:hypothetical protein
MQPSFLLTYLDAFQRIEGWFSFDAALLFMAYNQLLASHGIASDVIEIGVHHGLSTIAIATLRGHGKHLYAIDLFEDLQTENVSRSGGGNRAVFERNMLEFFGSLDFVRILPRSSAGLGPTDLGRSFSFCHVDGGHSRSETYSDLVLGHEILLPGGLLALDDYFNVEYPGVCEGAVEFMLRHPGSLRPLAIGFNKVVFQKQPASFDLNADFRERFPQVECKIVPLWDQPTILVTSVLRSHFDLQASKPDQFHPFGGQTRAILAPEVQALEAKSGQPIRIAVDIANRSLETFPHGEKVFGLSYHLLSKSGQTLSHDNDRTYLTAPLAPGESARYELPIVAPSEVGEYRLELDLVWEGVMWFRDIGNPTVFVELVVA